MFELLSVVVIGCIYASGRHTLVCRPEAIVIPHPWTSRLAVFVCRWFTAFTRCFSPFCPILGVIKAGVVPRPWSGVRGIACIHNVPQVAQIRNSVEEISENSEPK